MVRNFYFYVTTKLGDFDNIVIKKITRKYFDL